MDNILLFIAVVAVFLSINLLKRIKAKADYIMKEIYKNTKDPGGEAKVAYDIKKYLFYCSLALIVATICLWEFLKHLF